MRSGCSPGIPECETKDNQPAVPGDSSLQSTQHAKAFLGLLGYYRYAVPNYNLLAGLLFECLSPNRRGLPLKQDGGPAPKAGRYQLMPLPPERMIQTTRRQAAAAG